MKHPPAAINPVRPRSGLWSRITSAIAAVAVVVGMLVTGFPNPLAQTPTAEQLKAFQNLPPAQRDAILQQLTGGGSAGSRVGGTGSQIGGSGDNQIIVERPWLSEIQQSQDGQNQGLMSRSGLLGQQAPAEKPPVIKGDEWLLIELVLPSPDPALLKDQPRTATGQSLAAVKPGETGLLPETQRRLEELRDRIHQRNPYQLNRDGVLQLPGIDPIPLGGLRDKDVRERLALDPSLRDFSVAVTVLRVNPQGSRALKPFGYEMFRNAATAFVPGSDIPVPDDYKVNAGDSVSVQLFGQTTQVYTLPVNRDGMISFPQLGPISVGGMSLGAARNLIEGRVRKEMIGTQARVTLSDLRSARVLVLGDAEKPGSYVVSGFATATTALFASGGVKPIGSLRTIEIKRGASLVRRLDLYDVLLKGDTTNDVHLEAGDAVFIPPVGPTVAVDGAVRRPAIYELLRERTVREVLAVAGGVAPDADLKSATLERIEDGKDRRVQPIDLDTPAGQSTLVKAGDLLRIPTIRPVVDNGVALEGHVYRTDTVAYRAGLRISDVLTSLDDLRPRADTHYLLVRREDPATRHVSVFSADLEAALAARGSAADLLLQPRDKISVFDLVSPRDRIVDPLIEEIRRQARPNAPAETVSVTGHVNAPGRYPLEQGMRISDLLRAGGGLEDSAYATSAELTRYNVADGDRRRADLRDIDLAAVLRGDANANIELAPYDLLTIKEMPEWGRVEEVELVGEVRFPGKYRIRRGETLVSVLKRAGGLTPLAFPKGAIFTREELKQREREQLDRLADRLQSEIATLSLQAANSNSSTPDAVSAGQGLLQQLRSSKPVGRLVIDLGLIASERAGLAGDVTLRGGDRLLVPRQTEEVTVLGEVQNPTSYLFKPGNRRDDMIRMSGGFTPRADRKRAYVVRADGSVESGASGWLGEGANVRVDVGDTVVVPLDAEKMRPLPMWTAVTTIIYNLAIAATAIGRL